VQSPHIVGVLRQRRSVPVVRQRPQGGAELGHERLHQPNVRGDDAVIRGQRHRALDRRNAGRDAVG
jgi:hypothetical protein